MTTAETIAKLRKLLSEATPGLWVFQQMLCTPGHGFIEVLAGRHMGVVMQNDRDVDEVSISTEDGSLVVAMRNELPALLDRLERLEQFVSDVEGGRVECGNVANCGVEMAVLRLSQEEE